MADDVGGHGGGAGDAETARRSTDLDARLTRAASVTAALGALFARTAIPVVALEPNGRVVAANQATVAAYGFSLVELMSMRIHDLQATGRPIDGELEFAARRADRTYEPRAHRRKDGSRLWVVPIAGPIDIDGETLIVSTLKNVTAAVDAESRERATADTAMRERQLLDRAITAMVAEHHLDRPLITLAQALGEVTGAATTIWLPLPNDRRRFRCVAAHGVAVEEHALLVGVPLDLDVETYAREAWESGEVVKFDRSSRAIGPREAGVTAAIDRPMFVAPLVGDGIAYGLVYGAVGTVAEYDRIVPIVHVLGATAGTVLQRAQLEEQSRRESLRAEIVWKSAMERISDGVTLLDHDNRIVRVNHAACALLDADATALIGKRCRDVFWVCRDTDECPHALVMRTGERFSTEFTGSRSGRPLKVEIVRVEPDHPEIATIHMSRDLTEERAIRSQLLMNDRLATMGRLAAGIAHEVNNPAAYLSLNLGFIRRQLVAGTRLPEKLVSHVDDAIHATEQITQIVRDLTGVTREQSRAVTDLSSLIASAMRIADHELRGHVRVETQLDPAAFAEVRAARIGQVVLNLALNARQAIDHADPARHVVSVRTRRDDDWVFIEVEDNGPGVPEAIRDKIFEPFFTTRESKGGTGLGLWLSRGSVEEEGGTLTLEAPTLVDSSGRTTGARFLVKLPAYPKRNGPAMPT